MATEETKKQKKAKKQQEIDKINLQIKQHLENEKLLRKQFKEQLLEIQQAVKELKDQKRKLKRNKKKNNRPVVWDQNTPLIKLVFPERMARFKKMLGKWQNYAHEIINSLEATHFDFDLQYQAQIFTDMKSAMIKKDHIFNMSDRQFILYMSEHSNLGSFDKIKKAIQRLE